MRANVRACVRACVRVCVRVRVCVCLRDCAFCVFVCIRARACVSVRARHSKIMSSFMSPAFFLSQYAFQLTISLHVSQMNSLKKIISIINKKSSYLFDSSNYSNGLTIKCPPVRKSVLTNIHAVLPSIYFSKHMQRRHIFRIPKIRGYQG